MCILDPRIVLCVRQRVRLLEVGTVALHPLEQICRWERCAAVHALDGLHCLVDSRARVLDVVIAVYFFILLHLFTFLVSNRLPRDRSFCPRAVRFQQFHHEIVAVLVLADLRDVRHDCAVRRVAAAQCHRDFRLCVVVL